MPPPQPPPPVFGPATAAWFGRAFAAPTEVQDRGWRAIAGGEDALLIAPTGSGKTLAAFLVAVDRIGTDPAPESGPRGWRAIYVSPLKALVFDVERNLHGPLRGIALTAAQLGLPFRAPRVDVRTGDTPQSERRRQLSDPGDILVTTPESLYLLLTSSLRARLATVRTLIVDEVHALAPTRRGAHLMLSVARLDDLVEKAAAAAGHPDGAARVQRIGLSATVAPVEAVAAFLGGESPVTVVDTHASPRMDLRIEVPVRDMTRPEEDPVPIAGAPDVDARQADGLASGSLLAAGRAADAGERKGLWPWIEPRIVELILAHRATLVFVNARGLAERLAQRLHEELVARGVGTEASPVVRAHHGSIAHAQRTEIESALKAGQLRALVATSSLELGIDMGTIDLVIQVAAPDSVARGMQRVGRAGHHVGGVSIGRIFPKHRMDLAAATVTARAMREGRIEAVQVPRNPLDVLAQHIVAMVSMEPWTTADLERLVRRTATYRDLSRELLEATLDMLAGVFPSSELADLRPRIARDHATDTLTARKGARLLAVTNGGTIADRGLFGVFLAASEGGRPVRVGELDEEMVHEARVGQTFILGASTWRITDITRDRVLVVPAPGEPGKLPFWRGEGPGRPIETGRALGALYRRIAADPEAAEGWLLAEYPLEAHAATNLVALVGTQRAATGAVPNDRVVVVERFRDAVGDVRVCVLSPFGARVHAPWALAIEALLASRSGVEAEAIWDDDGFSFRLASSGDGHDLGFLAVAPDEVEELVLARLGQTPLFASLFREVAARSLLLPRRSPEQRAPLWQQRLRAAQLLQAVRPHARFPVLLEAHRTAMRDIFDLPALRGLLADLGTRKVRLHHVETEEASPMARGLVFAFAQTYMYAGDQPVAERRAQALTLDRGLLRELLGEAGERALFDRAVLEEVERELRGQAGPRVPRDADGLRDLLRQTGGLREDELAAAWEAGGGEREALGALCQALATSHAVVTLRVGGAPLIVAGEDVALYRDALGAMPPSGLPARLLLPVEDALATLLGRFAAAVMPFELQRPARRFALPESLVASTLERLVARGRLVRGPFHPDVAGEVHCDAELLRRIRRRLLARLRDAVAPVPPAAWASFLAGWHGLSSEPGTRLDGAAGLPREVRLREVLARLEGLALPLSEWERRILPARLPGYRPELLDRLLATGDVAWVGRGALGGSDGRVAFYQRGSLDALLPELEGVGEVQSEVPDGPLHGRILAYLEARGSAFGDELLTRVAAAGPAAPGSAAASSGCPPGLVAPGSAQGGPRASEAELVAAVWDLVWAGRVTNDAFLAARATLFTSASTPGRFARGRILDASTPPRLAGRWSLVRRLVFEPPPATARRTAVARLLLERHGLVTREVVEGEELTGGFAGLYPTLKALEELGAARRGHFIDGMSGIQFAAPGVVDRLRAAAAREAVSGEPDEVSGNDARLAVHCLAAVDPASPYGAALAWPEVVEGAAKPRRQVGATVVLARGVPLLWVSPKADRLTTFPALRGDGEATDAGLPSGPTLAIQAFEALGVLARVRGPLEVRTVDGVEVRTSPWETPLRLAGFRSTPRGLSRVAEPTEARSPPRAGPGQPPAPRPPSGLGARDLPAPGGPSPASPTLAAADFTPSAAGRRGRYTAPDLLGAARSPAPREDPPEAPSPLAAPGASAPPEPLPSDRYARRFALRRRARSP
jgi:ATP-dependent Lhr-like helicase